MSTWNYCVYLFTYNFSVSLSQNTSFVRWGAFANHSSLDGDESTWLMGSSPSMFVRQWMSSRYEGLTAGKLVAALGASGMVSQRDKEYEEGGQRRGIIRDPQNVSMLLSMWKGLFFSSLAKFPISTPNFMTAQINTFLINVPRISVLLFAILDDYSIYLQVNLP